MVKYGVPVWLLLLLAALSPTHGAAARMERPVSFVGAGGVTLAGTLTLPPRPAPVPALVLVGGSGPTDRDGNQPPILRTDLLRQIAADLAKQGIASLRYDKRGQYASGKPPATAKALYDFVAWQNYVGDAAAAFRWLQAQPGIQPARVGLLGHSEGGLLALDAADALRKSPPAVLVLVSTPGRPISAVLHEQLERLLLAQRVPPAPSRFFLDKNDAILAEIQKTGRVPTDVPPGLAALYQPYLGKFLQGELGVKPTELVARFPGSVLVLQGGADAQVSPDEDAALLGAVRRKKGGVPALVVVPGASHNLKRVHSDLDLGFSGAIVPGALNALNGWLAAHLLK